ncbi:partial Bifunctional sulfatase/alpha-L-rhamnosidase, partial [Anaerolineae bacterium]
MKRVLSNRRERAAVVVVAVLLLALVPVLVWGQSPPTSPTSLFIHSTDAQSGDVSPATDVDLTPVFSAIFNDPDSGALGKKVKIQVSTDQTFANVSHWNSGQIAVADIVNGSRCANVDYNGSALSGLATYYWRCRFWDEADAAGVWSAVATFTTGPAPLAPLGLFVDSLDASAGTSGNPVEEIDQTPVFTAVFAHQSDSSPAQKAKIQVSTDPAFTTITHWNSGQLVISNTANASRTPNIPYGGQYLSGDSTYYWRIRLTDDLGNIGPWSTEAASFHTNVVPSQPSLLQVGSTEAQTGSSGNPVAGIDLTPVFSALFN